MIPNNNYKHNLLEINYSKTLNHVVLIYVGFNVVQLIVFLKKKMTEIQVKLLLNS